MWHGNCENLKVYDLNGNKIKEINSSNDKTLFIDSFYNKKNSTNYILTGNKGFIKSYNFNENQLYHEYPDNKKMSHLCIVINDKEDIIKLIESCCDEKIRVWNFDSAELLKTICINFQIYGICLWDNDNLLIGCQDKCIKLINLKNEEIKIIDDNFCGVTIKKLKHNKIGECFISQSSELNEIKLWINNNI